MSKPITCGHPERAMYRRGMCRPCYRSSPYVTRASCHPDRPNEGAGLCDACRQQRDPDRVRAWHVSWYAANGDSARARAREYATQYRRREGYAERAAAYNRSYQIANPERVAEIQHRRRARKRANGVLVVTERDLRSLRRRHRGLCAYCDRPATELDHVIPISRGGRHAIGNLLPCCRSCNSSKRDRLLVEWRRSRPA